MNIFKKLYQLKLDQGRKCAQYELDYNFPEVDRESFTKGYLQAFKRGAVDLLFATTILSVPYFLNVISPSKVYDSDNVRAREERIIKFCDQHGSLPHDLNPTQLDQWHNFWLREVEQIKL